MTINLKKILLAGTALVAASAFSVQAQAASLTLGANGTWGSAGTHTSIPTTDVTSATAGDSVAISGTAVLTVTNNGVAMDTAATPNTFTLGALTGATTGGLTVTTGSANDLAVTVASTVFSGAAAVAINNTTTTTQAATVGFTGALSTGGTLTILNSGTAAKAVAVTVGGDLTVTGASSLTATAFAGAATSALTVTGNSTFTGGMTVTGGTNVAATSTLTLNGATNTGNITLTNGAAGAANLVLSAPASAQTVGGVIGGNGTVTVSNALGATFSNTVTATGVTVENAGGGALNSAATFKKAVTAAITLGGAGTGTNTVTFDGTGAGYTVTGAIAGAIAGETDNISVVGGNTIVQATASTANLDNLSITGTGTILDSNAALTLGTGTTIGTGATLDVGAGLLTSPAVTVTGTLLLSGAGGVTGVVDGSSSGVGTLSVTGSSTVTGNIGTTQKLAAINVATGQTLTATADVKATTTTLTGTGALALGALAHNVTTNVVAAANGDGAITVADGAVTTAITGNIGTSSAKVATLTVAGGAANLVTTTGNLYVNAITQNAADTLEFLGTSAQTVSGTVTGGNLIVGTGGATDVTFGGVFSGAAITVGATGKATFNANATGTSTLTNGGTVEVAAGKTVTVTNNVDASVGTYNIHVNQDNLGVKTFGKITESAGAVNYTGDTIHFIVDSGSSPLTAGVGSLGLNDVFSGTSVTNAGGTVTDNSYLYSFALVDDTLNHLDVTIAVANTINATATTPGNANVGNVLQTTLAASTNTQINQLQALLGSASDAATVNNVLELAQPAVDGGAQISALDVGSEMQDMTDVRMASLRSGEGLTGVAAGASANGVSMWAQGYGQSAKQDMRSAIDGYDSHTWGGAIGADTTNLSQAVLGIAFNYGRTNADSKNATTTATDVDNYGVNLYGNYDINGQMFTSGQVGYAYNKINSDRHNADGAGATASGDTHSDQYTAKATVGSDYITADGAIMTPTASAAYAHLSTAGYTETGAGGANLTVADSNMDVLNIGVGMKMAWKLKYAEPDEARDSVIKPSVHAGYSYDVLNDKVETTSSFVGDPANTAFVSTGASPARSRFNAGVGLAYITAADWDVSANYDFTYKTDYMSHSGTVRATSHF